MHVPEVHVRVRVRLMCVCVCVEFLEVERRYNYTTPKTFLELIKLYKSVLLKKRKATQVRHACTCAHSSICLLLPSES